MDKSDPFLSFLGINELPSVANPEDEATPTEQPEDSKGKGKGKKRRSSKTGETPVESSGSTQKAVERPNKRLKNTAKVEQQESKKDLTTEQNETPNEEMERKKPKKEPATFARRAFPLSEFGRLKWNAIKRFTETIKPHLTHYSVEEDTHTSHKSIKFVRGIGKNMHEQNIFLTKLPLAWVALGVFGGSFFFENHKIQMGIR